MTQSLGTITRRDDEYVLTQVRELRAPVEDVWATITEPERLARWIGTWTGDPESGSVLFAMTFEGQEEGDLMVIRACEPPRRLHVTSRVGEDQWRLELDLSHADGVTTLTFTQPGVPAGMAGEVGAGWDYYLDRLVDVVSGADPAARDFGKDYLPTGQHYASQLQLL